MGQRLKIFVSLGYAIIFMVLMGLGALHGQAAELARTPESVQLPGTAFSKLPGKIFNPGRNLSGVRLS